LVVRILRLSRRRFVIHIDMFPVLKDGTAMRDRSSNPPFMDPTLHTCELNPGCLFAEAHGACGNVEAP
jgi:hypothetical protein